MLRFSGILATFFLSAAAWSATDCDPYLRQTPEGNEVGIYRIETIKGENVGLYDVSDYVREIRLPSDHRINVFKMDALFASGRIFLGFGYPNVFMSFPPEITGKPEWEKFSAKSFRRADTTLDDTRGYAQSGLLAVFKNLTPERAARLYASAQKHVGRRGLTCVNLNGCMMADAGMTVGGESPSTYYLPGSLMKGVLTYGIEMDGEPLELDIVRVNPVFLEQIKLGVDKAAGTTFCRHGERACAVKKGEAGRFTGHLKRAGQRVMHLVLGKPKTSSDRPKLESKVVRMPPDGRDYPLRVSQPSSLGVPLRLIWGPHTLFEVPLAKELVDHYLPDVLKPFPQLKPNIGTRIKKSALFAPPVVSFLRKQIAARFREFPNVSTSNLFGMLRTDSPEHKNRYNLVILGDRAVVMKISISMRIVDWLLSKHLILSGYAKDARFAGEFMKSEDGEILLNRNSGTYQPTAVQLLKAAELLARIFPGVTIRIVDSF